jgi:hypothetical protein
VSGGWNSDVRTIGGGVVFGGVQKGGPVMVAPAQNLTIVNDAVVVGADGAPVPVPLPAQTDQP